MPHPLVTEDSRLPGAPELHYANGQLFMEGVRLADLAQTLGTPLFAYSKHSMLEALKRYQLGFEGRRARVHYAMKANSNLALLQLFARAGCGFDVVSQGELERVLAAGGKAKDVIFSGVGKTRGEIARALREGILCFNVESTPELEVINEVALGLGLVAPISIRVNPNVDPKTHPYISTGLKDNKFGVAHEETLALYLHAKTLKGLRIEGIDCHIGSQITTTEPYVDALNRVLDLVEQIESHGMPIHHLDFGGGLGIQYNDETPPDASLLWRTLWSVLDARGFGDRQVMVEPGRSLVGNAGVCLSTVQYVKPGEQKNFCIVDAAMNDLPRPAMYEAFHAIVPLSLQSTAKPLVYDVVGPVCESGDWLGRARTLSVEAGDMLAVLSAGAYCTSMSSNYNTRGRAAEVLIDEEQWHLIRERETTADQLRLEKLLD
jgi:diaminopimelate decarboxylase